MNPTELMISSSPKRDNATGLYGMKIALTSLVSSLTPFKRLGHNGITMHALTPIKVERGSLDNHAFHRFDKP